MQPFPERLIEVGMIGMIVAAVIGLLILIAPNFGLKPKPTVDGWRFPVKPTCLLLYYLALCGGMVAVGFSAAQLLASGTSNWVAWAGFWFWLLPGSGGVGRLARTADPGRPGLLEGRCASSRIRWQELMHVREYRIRCDRGVVIQGAEGKELVVADIAYDSEAVLDCLLQWRPVPYYSLQDEVAPLSILSDHHSR